MLGVTLAQVRAHSGRYIASALAVVIAVAFVVATLVLGSTTGKSITDAMAAQYTNTDVVVTADELGQDDVEALRAVPGVAALAPDLTAYAPVAVPGRGTEYASIDALADDATLRWQRLSEGALPAGPGQVLVGSNSDIAPGTELRIADQEPLTVTGVVDLKGTPQAMEGLTLFAPAATVAAIGGDNPVTSVRIRVAGDPTQVMERVRAVAGPDATVHTGAEAAKEQTEQHLSSSVNLSAVLLGFAAIAVVVAGLVIANTFAVLVAGRTRDLALLRSIGATSAQVRRSVRAEALVVGVVSSVLGVLAGIGAAAGLRAAALAGNVPIPLGSLSVPWTAVAAGVAVGVVVTLLAAASPARAATTVSPLAAFRPMEVRAESRRVSWARYAIGGALLAGGTAGLAVGAVDTDIYAGCAGGLAFFVGVAVLARQIIPTLVARAGGVLARFGGPVGELAVRNAGRNPRRTAATAMALLIGITLTSTLVVGAGLGKQSAADKLDAQLPVDFAISSTTGELPPQLVGALSAVEQVEVVSPLRSTAVTTAGGTEFRVLAVDPASVTAVAKVDLQVPQPGTVLLWQDELAVFGVRAGDTVTVDGAALVVAATTHEQPAMAVAAGNAAPDTVWVRVAPDLSDTEVAAVQRSVASVVEAQSPGADITGTVALRATIDTVINTMLIVVGGLLSVAVLIALIGVGNTMALSVIERRREAALLRVVGLSRASLRTMLVWEAVLVAAVAAALGVVMGVAFGIAGVASLVGVETVALGAMPWLQLLGIVLVAGVAGVLAALLPARRAMRAEPVEALG